MPELTKRYIVMAVAAEAPFDPNDIEGLFVLKPWKDLAALKALEAYRDNCYPELARDLDAWIRTIKSGPTVRGGVGARNEPYAKRAAPAARPTVAASAKTTRSSAPRSRPRPAKAKRRGKRR